MGLAFDPRKGQKGAAKPLRGKRYSDKGAHMGEGREGRGEKRKHPRGRQKGGAKLQTFIEAKGDTVLTLPPRKKSGEKNDVGPHLEGCNGKGEGKGSIGPMTP